jgi:Icc-related predicted phosphoesterase
MNNYREEYVDNLTWLNEILIELNKQNQKAIVITHYPPMTDVMNPKYKLDNEYVSHLDVFLNEHHETIKLWICGHVHDKHLMEKSKVKIYINSVGESHEHGNKLESGVVNL